MTGTVYINWRLITCRSYYISSLALNGKVNTSYNTKQSVAQSVVRLNTSVQELYSSLQLNYLNYWCSTNALMKTHCLKYPTTFGASILNCNFINRKDLCLCINILLKRKELVEVMRWLISTIAKRIILTMTGWKYFRDHATISDFFNGCHTLTNMHLL